MLTDTDMPDKNSKPVVLLIYANTGSALDCLKPETDTIAAHLKDSWALRRQACTRRDVVRCGYCDQRP